MMKTTICILLLLICLQQTIKGQNLSDTLVVHRITREVSLYMFNNADARDKAILKEARRHGFFVSAGTQKLFWMQAAAILNKNPEAAKEVRKVKNTYNFASAFETITVAGIGLYSIFSVTTLGSNPSTKQSLTQLGIIFGSLFGAMIIKDIILKSAYKPARNAIDLYNQSLKKPAGMFNPEIRLRLAGDGVGVAMRF